MVGFFVKLFKRDEVLVAALVGASPRILGLIAEDSRKGVPGVLGVVGLVMQVQKVAIAVLMRSVMEGLRLLMID